MRRKTFYVYEHWRPDKDLPFYVGKGTGGRAYCLTRENCHYTNVVAKLAKLGLCVEVRLVLGELTEMEAYALEKERIAFWRSLGVTLTNKNEGGWGCKNPVEEVRKKMSVSQRGRPPISEETRAKLRLRIPSAETRAKMSLSQSKRIIPAEVRAKMSLAHMGKTMSEASRAKMSAFRKGRKHGPPSVETRLKISAAKLGKLSAESRARIGAAQRGKIVSAETREKMSIALKGKIVSAETREKMRASAKRRWEIQRAE